MNGSDKVVDGFSFMPPSLSAWIKKSIPDAEFSGDIPWTALKKAISETTFSLMTSAGISRRTDPPFDMEREKREPTWGDPTHREIPSNSSGADIDANHLHINTAFIKDDINVMLPLARFGEFEREGVIGKLSPTCYSYYGFQLDPKILIAETMPRVAARMHEEGVEAVILTPA